MVQVSKKQAEKLKLIKRTQQYDILIPKKVEDKIRHLCSMVHDVEWSGVLFYKKEGTFENNDLKVTCVDILPMDIGTSGYTEFKDSPDVVAYECEHDELLEPDVYEGLIHSHNHMSTFFSGTDTGTLNEEGTDRNHFVSLIVNNAGSYTAAVTRRIKQDIVAKAHIVYTTKSHYGTWDDVDIPMGETTSEKDKEEERTIQYIEWFDLRIHKESSDYDFNEVDDRLSEIRKNKAAESRKPYSSPSRPQSPAYNQGGYNQGGYRQGYGYEDYGYGGGYHDDDVPFPRGNYWGNNQQRNSSNTQQGKKGNQIPIGNYGQKEKEEEIDTEDVRIPVNHNEEVIETEETITPLCIVETYDNDLLNILLSKLLTGNILSDVINYDTFMKDIDKKYETFFGPLDKTVHTDVDDDSIEENNKRIKDWFAYIVEILVYTRDEDLLDRLICADGVEYTEADTAEVCAAGLIKKLDSLPDSYVKDMMVDELLTYIPDGAEEYIRNSKA